MVDGGMDLFSSCLEPGGAITSPHQGKTRNTPTKGERNSTMSLDLKAVADFFSLENAERFLNCVTLPVDPRSPNTRAMGLTFTFSNVREEGGDVVAESRQDSSPSGKLLVSGREAAELSFMAEREAVMNGVRMKDEEVGDSLFQHWQRGWGSNALASTPKVSNYFHFPSSTLSPQAVDDSVTSPDNLHAKGTDTDDFFTGMTTLDVPGGLWSLGSNDVSDGNQTSLSASVSNYCNIDERVTYEGIEAEEEEEEEEKGEDDLVMMMRSPTNQNIPDSRNESRGCNVIDEGTKDDLFWKMRMRLKDINNADHSAYNFAQDNPIFVAQMAVTQANYNCNYWPEESQRNEEQSIEEEQSTEEGEDEFQEGVSNESDSHDSKADTLTKYSPELTDEEEDRVAMKSSSSSKSEAVAFQYEENRDEDEYSSYIPNSNEVAYYPLPPTDVEQKEKVIILPPSEPKKYSNEDEANRHFDEIFSSFELSLNRHVTSDNNESFHVGDIMERQMERQCSSNHHNRTKLPPLLAAAAQKMKTQGTRKNTRQVEQNDARRVIHSSTCPSTFLEGTVMGRKLNHRFTPPSSPATSDTSKHVTSSIRNVSESIISHADNFEEANHRPTLPSVPVISNNGEVSSKSLIDLATNTIFEANAIKKWSTPPSSCDPSDSSNHLASSSQFAPADTTKLMARSDGNGGERLIDRVKKTIFQANNVLESVEYDTHTEMNTRDVPCETIDCNVDEINFDESCLQTRQLQDRSLQQCIAKVREVGMMQGTAIDEDCPDDEKMVMRDFKQNGSKDAGYDGTLDKLLDNCHRDLFDNGEGGTSFDSTVNWDGLNYSMSDSVSVSINNQALDLHSPTFKTSNSRSVSHTMTKIYKNTDCSASLLNASRPPLSPPRQSDRNRLEDDQLDEIAFDNNAYSDHQNQKQDQNENKSSTNKLFPITHNVVMSSISPRQSDQNYLEDEQLEEIANAYVDLQKEKQDHNEITSRTNEVHLMTSNGMTSFLHKEKHVNPLSPKHGNDAWSSIEEIKRCHDEEIRNIQMIANDIIIASSSPVVVKENIAPLSPRNSNGTTSHLKQVTKFVKKHDDQDGHREQSTPMTPRSFDAKMQIEVQSRIDAMKEQHKINMEKMRGALEDIKDDSTKYEEGHCGNEHAGNTSTGVKDDDAHIAICVGTWKWNVKKFDKAKERYSSWKTSINSSAAHPGEHDTRRHFKFDDAIMEKESLSPRVKQLMLKNEELEGEMRKIRLLSPKKSTHSPTSLGTNDSLESSPPHLHTPSSARYTTPRPSHHLYTPSSARCTTPNSSKGPQYQSPHFQTLRTILSDESELTPLPPLLPPSPPMAMAITEHLLEESF
ncbi:hypothetical protein ACHAXA_000405 [Cyclostephanos tholiformis]|uniref:Uncharacterized protein n=1 Tax=Cyclostephanos tholiformis TaxID=382380 RepID=A0ABD3RIA3_9STRA